VQKFTRPITREIELGGERLAVTLTESGVSMRPVGSRKPPWEAGWGAVLCQLADRDPAPTPDEVAAAVAALKKGKPAKKAAREPAAANPTATAETKADPSGRLAGRLSRPERWLAKHRPRFLKSLQPGASEVELQALQAELGLELPEELRTLLAWHNGQGEGYAGRFEENWLFLGTERIASAKRDLDLQAPGNGDRTGWRPEWIPFLDDDGGDYLCLDTGAPGVPVRAFWLGQPEHPVVAPSLTDWAEEFVKAVEAGEYHEEPERGTFLRRQRSS
jgi:cell wall assembly regulator SMI1